MTRVVLVGPVYPFRGGIAHHTTMLARAMQKDHEVRVLSYRSQYPLWLYPGRTDKDPSADPFHVKCDYDLEPLTPWTWRRAKARIVDFSPEVTAIQWWTTFWAPALGWLSRQLRREGVAVTYIVHNVLPHEPRAWDRPLARFALTGGTAFVTHTQAQKELLCSIVPGSSCDVLPHPVYDMVVGPRLTSRDARERLSLPASAKVVLFFGFVRPYKGLHRLMQAVAQLRASGSDVFLVVAGEFWEPKDGYQKQAQHLGIAGCTRFDDRYIPNEELGVYFSAADVLVAPYVSGTQSGAVRLAVGFGLPVVTTQPEDATDVVGLGPIVLTADDPGAIASAIGKIQRGGKRLAGVGDVAARQWVDLGTAVLKAGRATQSGNREQR